MLPPTILLAVLVANPAVPPPMRLQAADPREEAATCFAEGEAAFQRKDYEEAVAQFERANQLMPHPHTLYNLGVAQEQAGDLTGAWASFRRLETTAESPQARDDARKRLGKIERSVAVLRVSARPSRRICLDSTPIPIAEKDHFEVAAREGDYELVVDDHQIPLRLVAGQVRVLSLTGNSDLWGGERTAPAVPSLLGITVGAGALATGLGATSIAVSSNDARLGLGIAATGAAAVATATGIAALTLHLRARKQNRRPRQVGGDCPLHPKLAQD